MSSKSYVCQTAFALPRGEARSWEKERELKPQDEGGAGRDSEFVTREHGGKTDAPAPPSPHQEKGSPPPCVLPDPFMVSRMAGTYI
ncbi:hypothetical protein CDAR_58181 [Caerostris darwini]|uniref:Uncharacterized protein n=1 Tax=Caerostris darwini TaxID=1538125 RepID=A0AAV4U729_9ARAC|nr:hypothetical protein CDAR_58181 [Caerostris darwini]